jgi:hypothetical protein
MPHEIVVVPAVDVALCAARVVPGVVWEPLSDQDTSEAAILVASRRRWQCSRWAGWPTGENQHADRRVSVALSPHAVAIASGAGTTSRNMAVSMNCRKHAILPSRTSQTCTTGRSSCLPVACPVPV